MNLCSACPGAFSQGTIENDNHWIESKCYKRLSNNSASFKILEKMNDCMWWIITGVVFQRNSRCSFETWWISSCCNFMSVCEVASSCFPKCNNGHKTRKAMLVANMGFQVSHELISVTQFPKIIALVECHQLCGFMLLFMRIWASCFAGRYHNYDFKWVRGKNMEGACQADFLKIDTLILI